MKLDLLNLLLVLSAALVAGRIAARLSMPAVLGELLAGVILGPALLGLLHTDAALLILAEVGVLLMMLYIGMEIDPRELKRASGGGLLAAIGGFVVPFTACAAIVLAFGFSMTAAAFVGLAAGVTSLATKSRILADLRLFDTRIAHVMMAGALVADVIALVAFAGLFGAAAAVGGSAGVAVAITVLKAICFFAVCWLAGRFVFPLVGRLASGHRTSLFTTVLLIAVGFGELAELAGLHAILGAFLAGMFLREPLLERDVAEELTAAVKQTSIGFLAPLFFVTAGFAVSFDVFGGAALPLLLAVVVAATVGKIVGTAVFYLATGHGWREGLTVGAGMNGRGAVEIIIAGIGLEAGLIGPDIFSVLVLMAILTTATVPLLLTVCVRWLERRGELHRPNTDLSAANA